MGDLKKNPNLHLIREEVRALSAYHVQDASGMIKLDAMENPYSLPDVIKQDWIKALNKVDFNRYPDPKASKLSTKLKKLLNTSNDIELLFGNGSDEIIQMLIMSIAKSHAKVMSVEPSFVMYKMIAKFCNVDYIGVNLNSDFSIDLPELKKQIQQEQPELIFLAQPNNPTGNLFSHKDLCEIIKLSKGLVVIDEAYTAFTDYDAIPLLNSYDNVLVMRTFSKTGLAGLRLGYLLGQKNILNEVDKIRLPYNINILTQSLALCALEHFDLFLAQSEKIIDSRNSLVKNLLSKNCFEVFQSEANFITLRLKQISAKGVVQGLKEKGILIKVLDGAHPLLKNCIRVTVGSEEENVALLMALEELHQKT